MTELNSKYVSIEWKIKDAPSLEIALTTFSNCGPINILTYSGEPDDEKVSGGRSYNFNADPFFRRNKHYFASGSLTVRPVTTVNTIIIVTFSNMFPEEEQPTCTDSRLEIVFTNTVTVDSKEIKVDELNTDASKEKRILQGDIPKNQSRSVVIAVIPK